ncbi:type II TA system antitoxin MqsA family protein [Sphingobium chungbukense]|uniref:XRE family transcriptional regulator n=1 Tax=Sphingobium chungbukense TaxID=56193 RepID=A0A0M3AY13_9SPHN|nr:type II TA system antitoxin MqsA family protein [Sphingobium chungbukense]KKW93801.1 XRE family transcriptional regulator [Sphingobium chungbukense]
MTETRVHPETGKLLRRDVRKQIVAFGSLSRTVDVPGWYPDDASDSIHSGEDLAESDRVFRDLKAAYGARVRRIRRDKLKLTQEEAGRLIGGGRRAFQKYESGATPPSDAAVGLIELLDRHPEELEFLRSIRSTAQTG